MRRMPYWLPGTLVVLALAAIFAVVVTVLQNHSHRDCLRFVSSHVTTDQAAWRHLVCHQ